jgi:hypothetical protein
MRTFKIWRENGSKRKRERDQSNTKKKKKKKTIGVARLRGLLSLRFYYTIILHGKWGKLQNVIKSLQTNNHDDKYISKLK